MQKRKVDRASPKNSTPTAKQGRAPEESYSAVKQQKKSKR